VTNLGPLGLGGNRRGRARLNRLARELYDVCRNAADPFELAAQLESLGYNRYRVNREFGFRTTFDLAEQLFALTPRRPRLITPSYNLRSPFWWHTVLLLAFFVTVLLYSVNAETPQYVLYIWLLAWAAAGTYVLPRLGDADTKTRQRVFSFVLLVGLTGLLTLLYALVSGPLQVILTLLWWQLPATFWLSGLKLASNHRLRHFIPVLVSVCAFFLPPLVSCFLLLLSALLLFGPFLSWPTSSTFRYLEENLQVFLLPALFGLGQGVLALQVLRDTRYPVQGLLFVILTVFAALWLETFFKRSVVTALWAAKSSEEFQTRLFRSLGFYLRVLVIVAFLAVIFLFNILLPLYSAAFLPFILLALAVSLGFLLLGFSDIFLPATAFSTASVLILSSIPFTPVVTALTAVLGVGVVLYITKVERYCADLL
jgi:hypothetical protein